MNKIVNLVMNLTLPRGMNRVRVIQDYKDSESIGVVVANLILCCDDDNKELAYSRSKAKVFTHLFNKRGISNTRIMKAIDYLADRGYVINTIQPRQWIDSLDKKISSCKPTDLFRLTFIKNDSIVDNQKIQYVDRFENIVIKDDDRRKIPVDVGNEEVIDMSNEMKRVNFFNLNYKISLDGEEIDAVYYRVFNNSSTSLNGRLYTSNLHSIENRISKTRLKLRIDGEQVAEVDYAALHIRILAEFVKCELPREDLYYAMLPDGMKTSSNRNLIKLCCVSMLNVESKQSALLSFRNHLKEVEGHTFGSPSEVLNCIYKVLNQDAIDLLYKDKIGLRICNTESKIMLGVINTMQRLDCPIYPIHDSAIVKFKHAELLASVMADEYRYYFESTDQVPVAINYINADTGNVIKENRIL